MKLLILTQAVDKDDQAVGFFHRWIEEFAPHCEKLNIVCLKAGRHSLPSNVGVYSLGKERGASRIRYLWNFYTYIWSLRNEYDCVFVHMNQEYVLLGWKSWWLMGKRVVLWRNHKRGSIWTHLACMFVKTVFYTSPEAYVAKFKNATKMPIGIDTKQFAPRGEVAQDSVLFLGRLDPVKKPEVFIAALKLLESENVSFHADMYGSPTYPKASHAAPLAADAAPLVVSGALSVYPSVANEETPAIFASHAVYVNLTPSGSFDKTIGEAMASGCLVVVANDVVRGVVPEALLTSDAPPDVATSIQKALAYTEEERTHIVKKSREYIEREHALPLLVKRVIAALA